MPLYFSEPTLFTSAIFPEVVMSAAVTVILILRGNRAEEIEEVRCVYVCVCVCIVCIFINIKGDGGIIWTDFCLLGHAHVLYEYTLVVAVNAGDETKKAEVSPRSRSWQQNNERAR